MQNVSTLSDRTRMGPGKCREEWEAGDERFSFKRISLPQSSPHSSVTVRSTAVLFLSRQGGCRMSYEFASEAEAVFSSSILSEQGAELDGRRSIREEERKYEIM